MTAITCVLQAVEIERGKDVIAIEVPAHEVIVLRAIHRPDAIRVTDKNTGEVELEGNAYAEYSRLSRKYQRNGGGDPVRLAFADGAAGLEKYGFDVGGGEESEVKAPQSRVRNHAKEAKAESAKAAKAK